MKKMQNYVMSITLLFFCLMGHKSLLSAQATLFDFDNAPLYSPLPISQTVNGITAHFSATGQGYSVQNADVLGFTPKGFAGHILDPSSIYLSDLLIRFDQVLTDFSIMYACQELACDDAATMRVTAYLKGIQAGTSTKIASNPGTYPVDTLRCSFPQGFDSVVVHYDSPPPTCKDYGVIFLADNMRVTAMHATGIFNQKSSFDGLIFPDPVSNTATLSFSLDQSEYIHVSVYDNTGRLIRKLFDGTLPTGNHQIKWNIGDDEIKGGVYFLKLTGENHSGTCKFVVIK
jgi:hypothetical protein